MRPRRKTYELIVAPAPAHSYTVAVPVDSVVAKGTLLYFCEQCGEPRRISRQADPCRPVSTRDANARIQSRVAILTAMVQGWNDTVRLRSKRRGRS